ncbi:hypothetical protein BJ138DRAFT_1120224 [Hygrophoropsis aurantiaca]|uniref:Uncharacterized protein n=1 Tax=Hygrophoropsis aurantiaca TaxID=72124 RepID=A0ACB7ZTB7_9AGAM|nr:hypothetical protein BJ138DRAFT_1120224 [Hygrophoropsis aurantiaca]
MDEQASLEELRKEISSKKSAKLTIKLPGRKRARAEESLDVSDDAAPVEKQVAEEHETHYKKAKSHRRQLSESSVDEEKTAAPAKKRRGRPPKPKHAPEAPIEAKKPSPSEMNFCVSVFVTVELPPRVIKGKTSRGDKIEKREKRPMGPTLFTHETKTWEDFLVLIAEVVKTTPDCLAVNSMGWYWNGKPKKTMLSLSNSAGLQTMVKQILASKTGDAGIIFVTMAKPWQKPKQESLPWVDGDADDSNKESESDKENEVEPLTRFGAKISVDKKIAPIVATLEGMYPVGNCQKHPDIRCFAHAPTKYHFELDTNRLKIWALAIDRGKTDHDRIPIGSNFFMPTDAIATKAVPVTPNCVNHTAPSEAGQYQMSPHTPFGHPYAMPPSPYHGYPPPMLYGYPPQYGHPPPAYDATTPTPWIHSPSSPL